MSELCVNGTGSKALTHEPRPLAEPADDTGVKNKQTKATQEDVARGGFCPHHFTVLVVEVKKGEKASGLYVVRLRGLADAQHFPMPGGCECSIKALDLPQQT